MQLILFDVSQIIIIQIFLTAERAVERGRAESQSHLVSMRETLEKQMDNLKSAWMDRDNMAVSGI